MTKRYARVAKAYHRYSAPAAASDDIFGPYVSLTAVLASRTTGLTMGQHDTLMDRAHKALKNLLTADTPTVAAWRDLTDVVNFLQSLMELEWAQDEDGVIEAAKGALHEAAQAFEAKGKLRLTGPGIAGLSAAVDQFAELTRQLSVHSYWKAVKHTKDRVARILRGGVRAGDTVVSI